MERDDLPPFDFRLRRKHGAKQVGGEKAKRGAEVVENEFRIVICRIAVAR